MVFMNKRSSTASRESGSDSDKAIDKTTDKTVTMKETNGNSSANDNLAMSLTFSDDACDNVTNANIRQRNSLRHSADVVNSNHQEATVINSQTHILCRERHSAFENNNISVLDTKNERHTVAVDNGEYLHGSLDGGGVVYRSSGGSSRRSGDGLKLFTGLGLSHDHQAGRSHDHQAGRSLDHQAIWSLDHQAGRSHDHQAGRSHDYQAGRSHDDVDHVTSCHVM